MVPFRQTDEALGRQLDEIVFKVKGSTPEGYEVTFIKDEVTLTALCTCPAGTYGNFCKHRIAILDGKTDSISSENAEKVPLIVEWLAGTDVEAALTALRQAEKTGGTPKDEITGLKRKLARAMNS